MKKIFLIITILVGFSVFSQKKDTIYVYEFNKKTDKILPKETYNSNEEGLLIQLNEDQLLLCVISEHIEKKLKIHISTRSELEKIIKMIDFINKKSNFYIFVKDENKYYNVKKNIDYIDN